MVVFTEGGTPNVKHTTEPLLRNTDRIRFYWVRKRIKTHMCFKRFPIDSLPIKIPLVKGRAVKGVH